MVVIYEKKDLRKPVLDQLKNLDASKLTLEHFRGSTLPMAQARLVVFVDNGYAHILKDRDGKPRTITATELGGLVEEIGFD